MGDYNPFRGKLAETYEKAKGSNPELENLVALSRAFERNNSDRSLSAEESVKNIKSNLVEIVYKNHRCSGLLITTNGYIITVNHMVKRVFNETDRNLFEYYFKTNDGARVCPEFGFYISDAKNDLALLKAELPAKDVEPVRFRVKEGELKKGEQVYLIGPKGYESDLGKIIEPSRRSIIKGYGFLEDSFLTNIRDEPSNALRPSGEVYVNNYGELVGICSYTHNPNEQDMSNLTGGIKPGKIIAFINKVRDSLVKEIKGILMRESTKRLLA